MLCERFFLYPSTFSNHISISNKAVHYWGCNPKMEGRAVKEELANGFSR